MVKREQLDDLYSLYGFSKQESEDYAVVYTYSAGYFNNAEIVCLIPNDPRADKLKKQYAEIGYAVRLVPYNNLKETHMSLFKGFFRIEQSNKRLLQEYNNYCDLQTKKLNSTYFGFRYSYIQGEYYFDNKKATDDLISCICDFLTQSGNRLVILEAAAGFGKTCTSYEVAKALAEDSNETVPLLAELSKHRKASIFKHVLQSEVLNKFTTLSYDLVTNEIESGRIPLIIDGFDELLSKGIDNTGTDAKTNNEDAQTMLDTMAELLKPESNAKIMLTSRKSSIFTGDVFDEWVDKHISDSNICRIQIAEPSIVKWIGPAKADKLANNGINISNISNPVLLTIFKNTEIESFDKEFKTIDDVLKYYFDLLLNRETERQQLILSVDEQYDIMTKLASYFVEFDISSEEAAFIKEILSDITEKQIDGYLNRYSEIANYDAESRPSSQDEFLMKLVHHALLDRISSRANKIGFINEFIFGLLICDALLNHYLKVDKLTAKYIDIAITAYSVKDTAAKEKLYTIIKPSLLCLSDEQQLIMGLNLFHKITRDFRDQTFDSIVFSKSTNWGDFSFVNCIFTSCTFESCTIHTSTFKMCQFYNCRFYDITVVSDADSSCELIFLGGFGFEALSEAAAYVPQVEEEDEDYRKIVLEQFWKKGAGKAERCRSAITLFKGTTTKQKDHMVKAISALLKEGFLVEKLHCYELNISKIPEVKRITGRD